MQHNDERQTEVRDLITRRLEVVIAVVRGLALADMQEQIYIWVIL